MPQKLMLTNVVDDFYFTIILFYKFLQEKQFILIRKEIYHYLFPKYFSNNKFSFMFNLTSLLEINMVLLLCKTWLKYYYILTIYFQSLTLH